MIAHQTLTASLRAEVDVLLARGFGEQSQPSTHGPAVHVTWIAAGI